MRGLDTNVLIRYLVQDDPQQSRKATQYIERHCTGERPGVINHVVLCEMTWVLAVNYDQSRAEIATVIDQLLRVSQLEVINAHIVWKALVDYKQSNSVEFSDYFIARINESYGCDTTVTFDVKASKQTNFHLLK